MNKRYLVTGASGFLGGALIEKLLERGHEVVALARNEGRLMDLKSKSGERLAVHKIIFGDISDPHVARIATRDVDGVFHLAAFKHVRAAETQPKQCIQSNVLGTISLLEAMDGRPYDFVIGISTDKAARVSGVYGATKLMMEELFRQYESYNPQTRYRIVRYGNVLFSTGSITQKWYEDMAHRRDQITLTDPNATRFFWSVEQAVDLIFECLAKAPDARPYVPAMKALSIGRLVEGLRRKYGWNPEIKVIGLQPGENLHETMDGVTYSNEVEQFSDDEILQMI